MLPLSIARFLISTETVIKEDFCKRRDLKIKDLEAPQFTWAINFSGSHVEFLHLEKRNPIQQELIKRLPCKRHGMRHRREDNSKEGLGSALQGMTGPQA